MSSASACKLCSKVLTAATAPSGLCRECLISTGVGIRTVHGGDNTRTAVAAPAADTRTRDAFSLTDFDAVPPPVHSSVVRMALLHDLHGFIDVTPMLTPGGMGDLYRAYDPALNRSVVVKFVRWDARSQTNLRRFAIEARALASVDHENVARLYSFVETGDPHFIMEDVPGGSLNERLMDGPLEPKLAARLLMAAARGVAAAHRQGVVHRDLKPANLLLTSQGPDATPKVADFGIAKDLDAHETLTQTSALIGTPGFMSPEQADWRSAECDARSDVWGLCASLFCAVTGKPPFDRHRQPAAVLFEPLVPPIKLRPTFPRELNAIICMGLEKDPADRYQTADELADDLGRFLDNRTPKARPRPLPVKLWRGARRVPKAVAAAMVIALLATAVLVAVLMKDKQATAATPEPTAEQKVDALMGELKQGRAVTLVGEKGLPVWSKVIAGHATVDQPAGLDGATGITSFGEAVVQLCPDIPIAEYTVEFELLDVAGILIPGPGPPQHLFGGIVGLNTTNKYPHGYAVSYCDLDRNIAIGQAPELTVARFAHLIWSENPDGSPTVQHYGVNFVKFMPNRTATTSGIWRPLRYVVSPTSVVARWQHDDGSWVDIGAVNAVDLVRIVSKETESLQQAGDAAAQLPPWSSNRPIGIRCTRATVGVRKVKITPQ